MTKAIALSIRSESVAKILNGEKEIEVRTMFPKDYKGWVYIYVTKNAPYLYYDWNTDTYLTTTLNDLKHGFSRVCSSANRIRAYQDDGKILTNGHIVARFWCDNVEECDASNYTQYSSFKKTRMSIDEYFNYLGDKIILNIYAIHISQLEIFDRPKELKEFKRFLNFKCDEKYSACWKCKRFGSGCRSCQLSKAPQNYCYIESEE